MIRILGIDPGLRKIAFTITETKKNITEIITLGIFKNKNKDISKIFEKIYDQINNIIITFKPNLIIYEEVFIYKNFKSVINIAKIQGIINSLSYYHNIQIKQLNPTMIKKNILKGNANKDEIKTNLIKKNIFLNNINKIIKLEYDIYDSFSINRTYIKNFILY